MLRTLNSQLMQFAISALDHLPETARRQLVREIIESLEVAARNRSVVRS